MAYWDTKGYKLRNERNLLAISVLTAVLLGGCSLKNPNLVDLKERGCEAFNFNSLLLTKAKAMKFIDKRSPEEINFQNSLWTAKEYCNMAEYSLTELIAEYGKRTKYNNLVSVREGTLFDSKEKLPNIVEIQGSNMQYTYDKSSFNFVAIKDDKIKYFKEGDEILLGNEFVRLYNKKEYLSEENLWDIEISYQDGKERTLTLNHNFFDLNGYKIIF